MKSDMEYAALVMGRPFEWYCRGANNPNGVANVPCIDGVEWLPLHDDGDSRRLEIACLNWMDHMTDWCPHSVSNAYAEYTGLVTHGVDITPEQYRAAVFALAAEIGKVMEGKDNAE